MKKIAMFGGTFNPIHNGHIELALCAAQQLDLEQVLLIPTHTPPHKRYQEEVTAWQRWEMCRLAVQGYKNLETSDLEIKRPGASYTVDTLRELHRDFPDAEIYLITGADMFLTVQNWKCAADIFSLAVICGVPRDQEKEMTLKKHELVLREEFGAKTVLLQMPLVPISSTEIRERIRKNLPIGEWVPPSVERYIQENHLYQKDESHKD